MDAFDVAGGGSMNKYDLGATKKCFMLTFQNHSHLKVNTHSHTCHVCKKHLHICLLPGYGQLEGRGRLFYHCILRARHIILKIC